MPELSQEDLAARYGWALSVLNSDPSLRGVFDRAVAETWAPERFVAEVRNTPWYKNNGEAMRQAMILKQTDPATWGQRVANQVGIVTRLAHEMGAVIGPDVIRQQAEHALMFGWNEQNLRTALSTQVGLVQGQYHGQAAANAAEIRAYAASMGVRLDNNGIDSWVKNIASGLTSMESARAGIVNMARSAFPSLAERIDAGETVEQIAAPYRQAMGSILEINAETLDLFDPTLRSALAGRTADGKPSTKTIWEFENDLRKDTRWLKTQNAQDGVMGVARQVLSDFGLAS